MIFWTSCLTDAMAEQADKKGAGRALLLWPFYRRTPLRQTRPRLLVVPRSTVEHPRSPA